MDSFNYSAIVAYRKCNTYFKHTYLDKTPSPEAPSGDVQFGQAIHLAIEAYLSGDDGTLQFDVFWDLEKSKGNAYGRFGWDELKDQGHRLLDLFQRRHLKKFEVYQLEQRLYGSYKDIKFEGTPDFIGKFEGVNSVVDFKTAGYKYHKDKIKVAEQLYLYAYMAETVLGYKVDQLVYFPLVKGSTPSIQNPLIVKYTQEDATKVLEDLYIDANRMLLAQEKKVFTKNRQSCIVGSMRCNMFDICHGGKNE